MRDERALDGGRRRGAWVREAPGDPPRGPAKDAVNVFFADEWDFVPLLREAQAGTLGAANLLAHHNEHVYLLDAHYGRMCWGVGGVLRKPSEIPERAVGALLSAPNDAGPSHAGQLSPYGPTTTDLRGFLRTCEENEGLSHDWLEPFGITVDEFHHQQRREG